MIKIILIIIFFFSYSLTFAQFSTYDLIVEFEQECYADSSWEHTHTSQWYDACYSPKGNLAEGYSFELQCEDSGHYSYVHKEPSWDGFREFVKKKYKR